MKLNISCPLTGCQKTIEVEDERKLRFFYDKRIGAEVEGKVLGDEWNGYIFRISGGNDKQGFPMMQGVLTTERVRLMLKKVHKCFRPRRKGERRRKSVRGCIVDSNLSVIALVVVKMGTKTIPGLTDKTIPREMGPKRASRIRKMFNLTKHDDVTQYLIKAPRKTADGKTRRVHPIRVQRLVTPRKLQRRRRLRRKKVERKQRQKTLEKEYAKLVVKRKLEKKLEIRKRKRTDSVRLQAAAKKRAAKRKRAATAAAK